MKLVLTVINYLFVALIYFFIYRTVRILAFDLGLIKTPVVLEQPVRTVPQGRLTVLQTVPQVNLLEGKQFALVGPVTLGRSMQNDIVLEEAYTSHQHARIFPKERNWYLEDLQSTNGTWLNGERITGVVKLKDRDEIRIGSTTFLWGEGR